ncbi:MAG: hypothetical protein KatS3mg035_2184 [Bacteroidia bacterium]|nr:MAG: hypothetical protein KatS3mg035_2184 [Bacteroidia bacterium]
MMMKRIFKMQVFLYITIGIIQVKILCGQSVKHKDINTLLDSLTCAVLKAPCDSKDLIDLSWQLLAIIPKSVDEFYEKIFLPPCTKLYYNGSLMVAFMKINKCVPMLRQGLCTLCVRIGVSTKGDASWYWGMPPNENFDILEVLNSIQEYCYSAFIEYEIAYYTKCLNSSYTDKEIYYFFKWLMVGVENPIGWDEYLRWVKEAYPRVYEQARKVYDEWEKEPKH